MVLDKERKVGQMSGSAKGRYGHEDKTRSTLPDADRGSIGNNKGMLLTSC